MDKVRLIWVPQYPTKLRYQEWWWNEFPKELSKWFEVIVLGESLISEAVTGSDFAPLGNSINFEVLQLKQYLELTFLDSDILLLSDISFPGIFANVLFHKRPRKCFAICHATSFNAMDYFASDRRTKGLVEKGILNVLSGVFVATQYHRKKLIQKGIETPIHVVGLPNMPTIEFNKIDMDKNGIVSAARICPQKVDRELEGIIEKHFQMPIYRYHSSSWQEYYNKLSLHKILIVTSKEETYGYQIIDAINCGLYIVAPKRCSYPEILEDAFLYENVDEMLELIEGFLENEMYKPVNKLDWAAVHFYENITKIMKSCK